jgi:hypothetical protein
VYLARNEEVPFPYEGNEFTQLVNQWFYSIYANGKTELDYTLFTEWIRGHWDLIVYLKVADEYKASISKVIPLL